MRFLIDNRAAVATPLAMSDRWAGCSLLVFADRWPAGDGDDREVIPALGADGQPLYDDEGEVVSSALDLSQFHS